MSDYFEMTSEATRQDERNQELNFDQSYERAYDGNLALKYQYDEDEFEARAPVAHEARDAQILPLGRIVEKLGECVDESENLSLPELKRKLSNELVSLHQLKPPAGVPTGIDVIDEFLLWRGLPKGDLTLLSGKPGAGATSLWIQTAAKTQAEKKWVAWINSDWELMPSALREKKINLEKLLVVSKPKDNSQLFWILQEMISSTLFELIGMHVQEGGLKIHQLQKLKKLARTHQVALVIISHAKTWAQNSVFSLVIDCQGDFFTIKRASHRPTPFTIPGGLVHADLMSQLTANTRAELR